MYALSRPIICVHSSASKDIVYIHNYNMFCWHLFITTIYMDATVKLKLTRQNRYLWWNPFDVTSRNCLLLLITGQYWPTHTHNTSVCVCVFAEKNGKFENKIKLYFTTWHATITLHFIIGMTGEKTWLKKSENSPKKLLESSCCMTFMCLYHTNCVSMRWKNKLVACQLTKSDSIRLK